MLVICFGLNRLKLERKAHNSEFFHVEIAQINLDDIFIIVMYDTNKKKCGSV